MSLTHPVFERPKLTQFCLRCKEQKSYCFTGDLCAPCYLSTTSTCNSCTGRTASETGFCDKCEKPKPTKIQMLPNTMTKCSGTCGERYFTETLKWDGKCNACHNESVIVGPDSDQDQHEDPDGACQIEELQRKYTQMHDSFVCKIKQMEEEQSQKIKQFENELKRLKAENDQLRNTVSDLEQECGELERRFVQV